MAYSPFALCVVIVVVCLLAALVVSTSYEQAGYGYVHKHHIWKTCHSKVHHRWLLGVRIVSFLYCLSVLIYDLVLWGPFIFEYYTQWSFTMLTIYFGMATVCSIKEMRNFQDAEKREVLSNSLLSGYHQIDEETGNGVNQASVTLANYRDPKDEAGRDGYALQILYQVVLGAVFVTDGVYWTCIFPSYQFVDLIEMSMHGVNLILLLADISLNNMAFYVFRGAYFFMYTAIFIFFSWIIHALGEKQWPYPFLDVSVNLAPLWYFLFCIVHFVAYGLVYGVIRLKNYCVGHQESSQSYYHNQP